MVAGVALVATRARDDADDARARAATTTDDARRRAEETMATLREDVATRQYFVTGELTEAIFARDCRFVDPTTDVRGLERYLRAVRALFDERRSSVRLIGDLRLVDATTIEGDYRAEGYLKLPWNPRVPPYEGHITWKLRPNDGSADAGLIVEQRQTWSISGGEALRETFTPGR
jgi:hypothetical protein|tara:strand:- start:4129 stop:4650 length:522 start_codon:yes stop_codon:yes gene_type:complete